MIFFYDSLLRKIKYAMRNFRNKVYGDYIRYTHSSCHSIFDFKNYT